MLRTFKIYRYDPDKDSKPYMQTIAVELDGSERMLLDALVKIKAQDPTLSFRRSCREGVCGSDAMNINGKNGLACLTNMRTLPQTVVLKPLPGLPVVRDLIVDMTLFFKQYESIKPYLINHTQPPQRERLQSPEEREELNGLYECILCASCSTSCPSFWWNPDKFVGPAGLLQAYRFLADSRDEATSERLDNLEDPYLSGRMQQQDMSETLLLHPHAYSKLRWRCRRGLLENDLFITNYFEAHASSMTQADAQALDALMALPDNDLLDLFLRKSEPAAPLATPQVIRVLEQVRNTPSKAFML